MSHICHQQYTPDFQDADQKEYLVARLLIKNSDESERKAAVGISFLIVRLREKRGGCKLAAKNENF